MELGSPALQVDSLPAELPGKPIYTLASIKSIANGKPLFKTGSSAQLCDDLEGWDEGWARREAQGDICILIADSH